MPGTQSHAPGTAAAPAAPRPDRTGCRPPGTRPRARSPAHARAGGGWHYRAPPPGPFPPPAARAVARAAPPSLRALRAAESDPHSLSPAAAAMPRGRGVAVRRGGVEEGDAALEGAADGREAVGFGRGSAPRRAPHRPGPESQAGSGGQETQRGPDVCPGPRAHLNRSLRSGRWAPAPPSRPSSDDDSWARTPSSRRSSYILLPLDTSGMTLMW